MSKNLDCKFETYIDECIKSPLHANIQASYMLFPTNITDCCNVIFYGPSGVGKYSQMLSYIVRYSPSELKYNKKICVVFNKYDFFIRMSDIHYEIDMALIGCHSKNLWHEIYTHIIDILMTKQQKVGFIVCKNFHTTSIEIIDNFYNYMQRLPYVDVKFIILTESISFIPDTIVQCCHIQRIARPSVSTLNNGLKINLPQNYNVSEIINLKQLQLSVPDKTHSGDIISDNIIKVMLTNPLNLHILRDRIYDIFVYNEPVQDILWKLIIRLIMTGKILPNNTTKLLYSLMNCLRRFNNNYRPIFHIEHFILSTSLLLEPFQVEPVSDKSLHKNNSKNVKNVKNVKKNN